MWHDAATWRTFQGQYEDFPNAVALMDCTLEYIIVLTGNIIFKQIIQIISVQFNILTD